MLNYNKTDPTDVSERVQRYYTANLMMGITCPRRSSVYVKIPIYNPKNRWPPNTHLITEVKCRIDLNDAISVSIILIRFSSR